MSDIRNQLIKDSYNYVLQSDLSTGVVYRIGGDVPVNPIFQSGLTINDSFVYTNGTEGVGYTLLTDGTGYAYWGPVSAATPSSGVTSVTAGSGLSGNVTTGAITLINTAPDQIVTISGGTGITTGGTYPNFTIVNSAPDRTITITGGTNIEITGTYPDFGVNYTGTTTIQGITGITGTSGVSANTIDNVTTIINTSPDQTVVITGGTGVQIVSAYPNFGINYTGSTGISGDYLPLSGGTVTGNTIFQSGLTANTISATTYYNLPVSGLTAGNNISITGSGGSFTISFTGTSGSVSGLTYYVSAATPTGVTLISGDRWFNTATGIELVWINDGDSTQWIQPFSVPGPVSPDVGYHTVTGITTGQTLTWDKTYWGISGSSNVNLTLPTTTAKDGYYIIIKDEAGTCGSYRIRLTPASGLIDGNNYVDMNINYMSLTCMVRGGNWYLI